MMRCIFYVVTLYIGVYPMSCFSEIRKIPTETNTTSIVAPAKEASKSTRVERHYRNNRLRSMSTQPKKLPAQQKKIETGDGVIFVEGYSDSNYVYGKLKSIAKGKLEGYVYFHNGERSYVYGEDSKNGVFNLYGQREQRKMVYLLRLVE